MDFHHKVNFRVDRKKPFFVGFMAESGPAGQLDKKYSLMSLSFHTQKSDFYLYFQSELFIDFPLNIILIIQFFTVMSYEWKVDRHLAFNCSMKKLETFKRHFLQLV